MRLAELPALFAFPLHVRLAPFLVLLQAMFAVFVIPLKRLATILFSVRNRLRCWVCNTRTLLQLLDIESRHLFTLRAEYLELSSE